MTRGLIPLALAAALAAWLPPSARADGETERLIAQAREEGQWSVVALLYGRLIEEGGATGPALALLFRERAEAYRELGDLDSAFVDCESAIEAARRAAVGYQCRGAIALELGDVDGALADLDHAIAADPGFAEAYHYRGVALMQLGDYGEALGDLDTAIELGLATAAAYADRCACHYDMGHTLLAEDDCQAAIAADPDYGWSYNNLALLRWQEQDLEDALTLLDQAVDLLPDERVPRRNRAGIYYERGAFDLAIADHDRLLAADPEDALTLDNRGMAHAGNGDLDRAIADHRASLELAPEDGYTLANLGYALIADGRLAEGEPLLEEAIAATGGDPWVHGLLGHAYLEAGDFTEAIAAFQRGWDQQGDTALLAGVALGLAHLGDRDEVDRIADQIVSRNPYHQPSRQHLAEAYLVLGDPERALRHLNAALATAPGVAETYHLAGLILTELGRVEPALADFERAIAMGGTSRIRAYHRLLAELGYTVGPDESLRDAAFDAALRACVEAGCDLGTVSPPH